MILKAMYSNIFMIDFERIEFADEIYSQLGRALIVSTNFENKCKMLAVNIKLKSSNIFNDEEEFNNFVDKLFSSSLSTSIDKIQSNFQMTEQDLHNGRKARNEIVHEYSKYLNEKLNHYNAETIQTLQNNFSALIKIIAKADLLISFLLAISVKEALPNKQFIEDYEKQIINWVIFKFE